MLQCKHVSCGKYASNKCEQARKSYHNKSSSQHYPHLQHLFRRLHLTPSKYTFTFFNSTGVCYVRVTTSQMYKAFSYVGCSTGALTTRESNRNRKFQQLQNQAIVHAELALRWWKKHNNYHQYVPLTIQHGIPTPDLQTVEAAYIQQLQPRLNYTHIHRHLKSKLSHFHQQKQAVTETGFASIRCKIRRKHLPQRLRSRSITQATCFRDQRTAWQTLANLSSNTRRRFDTTKQLMKHSTASPGIYALHKMTHNMAPTHQRTARKSLATVLTKRKLPTPKGVAPLLTFPLGHASFQTDVRQFLRERVSKHRDQTIPFHPPSTKVVFRRHPQIQQVLHNWRTAHHQWVPDHPPPCACQHLHASHYPHLFHGHIATPLSELLPDQRCLKFRRAPFFAKQVSYTHSRFEPHSAGTNAISYHHPLPTTTPLPPFSITRFNSTLPPPATTSTYTSSNKYNNNSQWALSTAKITTPAACCGSVQHYTTPPSQTHSPSHTFSPFHKLMRMDTQQPLRDVLPNYKKHFGDWGKIPIAYDARSSSKKDAPLLPLYNPLPKYSGKPFPTCSEPYAGKPASTPSEKVTPLASCANLPHSSSKQPTTMKPTSCTTRTLPGSLHP